MRKLLVLFLALALVATACSAFGTAPAATIGGDEISAQSIEDELQTIGANDAYRQVLEQSYGSPTEGSGGKGTFNAAFTAQILSLRVWYQLIERDLERRRLEVTDDVLAQSEQEIRSQFSQLGPGVFDAFPPDYRERLIQQRALIAVVQQDIQAKLGGSEREFYENNPDTFAVICISHLLVGVQGGRTPEEAQARAEELYQRIEDGEDFEKLATEESDDPSAAAAGGFLDCGSKLSLQFDPVFEKAAFALEDDVVSEPVQTQFGTHLIRVSGREVPSFGEVRDTIQPVMQQTLDETINGYLVGVICDGDVDVNPRYGTWGAASCDEIVPQLPSVQPPEGPRPPAVDPSGGFDEPSPG